MMNNTDKMSVRGVSTMMLLLLHEGLFLPQISGYLGRKEHKNRSQVGQQRVYT